MKENLYADRALPEAQHPPLLDLADLRQWAVTIRFRPKRIVQRFPWMLEMRHSRDGRYFYFNSRPFGANGNPAIEFREQLIRPLRPRQR